MTLVLTIINLVLTFSLGMFYMILGISSGNNTNFITSGLWLIAAVCWGFSLYFNLKMRRNESIRSNDTRL